jgi:hypothetical protein
VLTIHDRASCSLETSKLQKQFYPT